MLVKGGPASTVISQSRCFLAGSLFINDICLHCVNLKHCSVSVIRYVYCSMPFKGYCGNNQISMTVVDGLAPIRHQDIFNRHDDRSLNIRSIIRNVAKQCRWFCNVLSYFHSELNITYCSLFASKKLYNLWLFSHPWTMTPNAVAANKGCKNQQVSRLVN